MEEYAPSDVNAAMIHTEDGTSLSGDVSPPLLRPSPLPAVGSLDDLSDDVILHTLSFVSCVRSLGNFALASRRARALVLDCPVSDQFFEAVYRKSFGYDGTCVRGGREQWKSLYRLRDTLRWGMLIKHKEEPLNTLGIVSSAEEAEAIFYDNPSYGTDQQYCIGYFGWQTLSETGPVMVWGDYNGVRVAPSLDRLLQDCNKKEARKKRGNRGNARNKSRFQAVGDNDGGFQVLTVLQSPDTGGEVSFFLGFASGMVSAVAVTLSTEGENVYETTSTALVHTSEVTDLAFVLLGNPCLLSCSVDGKVYMYPQSAKGRLEGAVLACSQSKPIFSISCTNWNDTHVLIGTGDPEGKVSLWQAPETGEESCRFDKCNEEYSSTSSCGENVLVTQLLFLHNDSQILVSATNTGEIRSWDVRRVKTKQSWGEYVHEPNLKLRHGMGMAHRGTIETIKVVGNILLTSGGNDGQIKGWDIRTGGLLGALAVHPGRDFTTEPHQRRRYLKSAVVDTLVCHNRESLVSLCRDGVVQEWSYREDQHKMLKELAYNTQNRPHKRKKPGSLGVPEHWEAQPMSSFVDCSSVIAGRKQQMLEELGQMISVSKRDHRTCGSPSGESLGVRMQKTIVYAGFRHFIDIPNGCSIPCPFVGADNSIHSDIQTAFDRFSGILPCRQCRSAGSEAYTCRLRLKHDCDDDSTVGSQAMFTFLRRLLRSKKVAPPTPRNETYHVPPELSTSSGFNWICERCQSENKPKQERCGECYGHRTKTTLAETGEPTKRTSVDVSRAVSNSASPPSDEGTSMHEMNSVDSDSGSDGGSAPQANGTTSTTVLIWECDSCGNKNPYRKWKCMKCGKRIGGPIMHVESDAVGLNVVAGGDNVTRLMESSTKVNASSDILCTAPMKDIAAPQPNDVLFGRSHKFLRHEGNEKFNALVSHQQIYYLHATRDEGTFISRGVVRAVRSQIPPGRFLQRNKRTGLWYDVGDSAATSKAHKSLWEIRRNKPKNVMQSETLRNLPRELHLGPT